VPALPGAESWLKPQEDSTDTSRSPFWPWQPAFL